MQNLPTAELNSLATISDYFNEPAIAEQLDWACEDYDFLHWMRERIEEASQAEDWDQQISQLHFYLWELKSLIGAVENVIHEAPEQPITRAEAKNYACAVGWAKKCRLSIINAAKRALAQEVSDETVEEPTFA